MDGPYREVHISLVCSEQPDKVLRDDPGEKEHKGGKNQHYAQDIFLCGFYPPDIFGTIIIA